MSDASTVVREATQAAFARAKGLWERWTDLAPELLTRLIAAAALILLGVVVLRLGRRLLNRFYGRWMTKRKVNRGIPERQSKTLHSLTLSIFTYLVYFSVIMAALSALGVNVSSLLAVAGVGGVAISFGAQTLVKDVISGLFLWVDGHISVGDVVTVAGQTGTVESMSVRTTVLRSTNGSVFAVPNGEIRTVVNMTAADRCAQVDIAVNHGKDWQKIVTVLQEEMEALKNRLERAEAPRVVGVIGTDRFCATVRIEYKCKAEEVWALEREIRLSALNRLTQEGLMP